MVGYTLSIPTVKKEERMNEIVTLRLIDDFPQSVEHPCHRSGRYHIRKAIENKLSDSALLTLLESFLSIIEVKDWKVNNYCILPMYRIPQKHAQC